MTSEDGYHSVDPGKLTMAPLFARTVRGPGRRGVREGLTRVPRTITVGVPVYRGAGQVAACLRSLQEQTFADVDVVISVDAADEESARACEPFLDDERFSLVVQPDRLDWYGNLNWLIQRPLGEFFCYRQHDDTTEPEFFQVLVDAAGRGPTPRSCTPTASGTAAATTSRPRRRSRATCWRGCGSTSSRSSRSRCAA